MTDNKLPPVHPGEVLLLDFLEPLGISQYALAKAIGVPPQRVLEIVHGRRAVTADTALRLGRYFGVEPQLWLPPAVGAMLEAAPVERVAWLRDEMANLVWAVESTIPAASGIGVDGYAACRLIAGIGLVAAR